MNDEEEERFRLTAKKFQESVRHRALADFPELEAVAREIEALLGSLDLLHLHSVPTATLTDLTRLTAEAQVHVQFTIESYPPEEASSHGARRPYDLERNKANVRSRRGQLENLHRQIFDIASPIIAAQQIRLFRIAVAPIIILEAKRSIPPDRSDDVLWRYMPLRNLFRCERAGGLWLSSLERLRAWSSTGAIADVREGDIPPVVQRLKSDYWSADAAGPEALDLVREELGLNSGDTQKMRRSLDFEFELTNAFVSSWCQTRNERSGLWKSFGDDGRSVAIRSTVGKILAASWRAPLDLFGVTRPNRITGLMLRDVKYLGFDEDDPVPSIDDLHLPLLKRDAFSDEHEIRLLAFTERGVATQGFSLHCDLRDIITEIVIGPNADFAATEAAILCGAPDLRDIPLTGSRLAPVANR